jgi:hypothetical protein
MKLTITSITLQTPFKFFPLSMYAMKILKQLKSTDHVAFKKRGVWTEHYTMTLWKSETELKAFAASGEHLKAMKESRKIAKEIRVLTIDSDITFDWPTAIEMLKRQGKSIHYQKK